MTITCVYNVLVPPTCSRQAQQAYDTAAAAAADSSEAAQRRAIEAREALKGAAERASTWLATSASEAAGKVTGKKKKAPKSTAEKASQAVYDTMDRWGACWVGELGP